MSNLQSVSDLLKNTTTRSEQQTPDDPTPNQNLNSSVPNSQTIPAEQQGETPTTQPSNPTKSNPPRKARQTRPGSKQGKQPNPNEQADHQQGIPIPAKDVEAALESETRTDTIENQRENDLEDDDDDTPQIISIRDSSKDAEIEQARRAKLALDKAVKAQDDGDDNRANFYYTIYHSLLPPKPQPDKTTVQPTSPNKPDTRPKLIDSSFASAILPKRTHPDGVTTEVRNLKFKWGVSNSHTDGGFAPYFHRNISELKGFIPLTIFNKDWQARALAWNAENRSKVSDEDKGLKYWGLKVPNEYHMSFSDWTLNYTVFYETMLYSYKFETLAEWILLHKANCDRILRKDGFMTALRYDIKVHTNVWQFKPIEDGEEYVSDFSKMKPETYEEAYGEARNNDELQFKTNNPYEIGGPREKWDAVTGTRPTKGVQGVPDFRSIQQITPTVAPTQSPAVPTNPVLPSKPVQPCLQRPGGGYQGNNFNPSYMRSNGRQGGRNQE
ncbi:hypothetical protein MJO28_014878 [Puccinia striiformis f. sp. tritici]|uniref:Uncharacterized protein n=1 Tax=Puccinia striiformis f. sp. tritici TaxID=168172 RepID=A0ACC0DSQ8_9BASI|nr:hypothetical protein MJO28_014878 [Puccinia striiformis f. sp. tritici]